MPLQPLLVIAGPTGSGKSELALRMAASLGGEIVNCDSLQVYRHFNVGTAKLSEGLRRGVAHHLIDAADPDETFTAGDYARLARAVVSEIAGRGQLPVIAGGTGFYLRALLDGLFAGPRRDEDLRAKLARRGGRRAGLLHRLLGRLDPAAAARIHPNDTNKLVRAIEVCLVEGRPLTRLIAERRGSPLEGFTVMKIALDPERAALGRRLDERCAAMFQAGLVDEVRHILALGYRDDAKPFESLGYRQALQYMRGALSLEEALGGAQRATRRYAKRQMTWFRRERDVHWLRGFGDDPRVAEEALALARAWLDGLRR